MSGTQHSVVSSSFEKNKWHNLNFVYDKSSSQQVLRIQSASVVLKESELFNFSSLDTSNANLDIGTGQSLSENFIFQLDNSDYTFNGYLDEFRIFHNLRKESEIDYLSLIHI